MSRTLGMIAAALVVAFGWSDVGTAGEVRLAEKGVANCVIVAPAGWANDVTPAKDLPQQAVDLLQQRGNIYRESIKDLALYLGKLSGSTIEIVDALPPGDKRIPVYVGAEGEKVFGPVGISKAGLFWFRVVADPKRGIGLYGESEYGTSYAIYELLHRLGCRWFMPAELGEVVPAMPKRNAKP